MKKLIATILFALILSVATSVSWGQELGVTWETLESVTWEVFESVTWE
jgi:hypothetical protein